MPLSPGDRAPVFELLGKQAGADAPVFRISEALAKGGVVLQFFPLPFTGVCETQMCAVRDHVGDYEGLTVWGITGHYPQLIAAWDREQAFDVPILADYDHEVSRAYVGLYEDVLPSGLKYCTKRGVVAIGGDGFIKFTWVTEQPGVAPSTEVVAEAIAAAKS
jgi:peroxiredoxin